MAHSHPTRVSAEERAEIIETYARYAWGLDLADSEMLLSAFAINGFFAAAAGILGASRILGVGVDTNSPDLLLVAFGMPRLFARRS